MKVLILDGGFVLFQGVYILSILAQDFAALIQDASVLNWENGYYIKMTFYLNFILRLWAGY